MLVTFGASTTLGREHWLLAASRNNLISFDCPMSWTILNLRGLQAPPRHPLRTLYNGSVLWAEKLSVGAPIVALRYTSHCRPPM